MRSTHLMCVCVRTWILQALLCATIICTPQVTAFNLTEIDNLYIHYPYQRGMYSEQQTPVTTDSDWYINSTLNGTFMRMVYGVSLSARVWPDGAADDENLEYVYIGGLMTFSHKYARNAGPAYAISYHQQGPIHDKLGVFWGIRNDDRETLMNSKYTSEQMWQSPALIEGATISSLTRSMYSTTNYFNTVQVSCCASASSLGNVADFPWLFRIVPDMRDFVYKLEGVLRKFNWMRIAVISVAGDFGESCSAHIKQMVQTMPGFEQIDFFLVTDLFFDTDYESDMSIIYSGLDWLNSLNHKIYIVCAEPEHAKIIYTAALSNQMVGAKFQWIAFKITRDQILSWALAMRQPREVLGLMSLNNACDKTSENFAKLAEGFHDLFGVRLDLQGDGARSWMCLSYDAAEVQIKALRETIQRLDEINAEYGTNITHRCLGGVYFNNHFDQCTLPYAVFREYTEHCDKSLYKECYKRCRVCGALLAMRTLKVKARPPALILLSVMHDIEVPAGATGHVWFDKDGVRINSGYNVELLNMQVADENETEYGILEGSAFEKVGSGRVQLNMSAFEQSYQANRLFKLYRRDEDTERDQYTTSELNTAAEELLALDDEYVAFIRERTVIWNTTFGGRNISVAAVALPMKLTRVAYISAPFGPMVEKYGEAAAWERLDRIPDIHLGKPADASQIPLNESLYLSVTDPKFYDGSSNPPSDRPPVTYTENHKAIEILSYVCASVALAVVFVTAFLLFKYRRYRVMRSGSVLFMTIILAGQFLVAISILTPYNAMLHELVAYSALSSVLNCCFFIGLISSVMGCIVKTYRILVIFNCPFEISKGKLTTKKLLLFFCMAMAPVWVGCGAYVIFCQPTVEYDYTAGENGNTYAISKPTDATVYFTIALIIYTAAVIMIAVYFAVKTRKVPLFYNETLWICWALYNMVAWFVLRVICDMTVTDALVKAFVQRFTSLVICVGFVCLIFLPKFFLVWTGRGNDQSGISNHPEVREQEREAKRRAQDAQNDATSENEPSSGDEHTIVRSSESALSSTYRKAKGWIRKGSKSKDYVSYEKRARNDQQVTNSNVPGGEEEGFDSSTAIQARLSTSDDETAT